MAIAEDRPSWTPFGDVDERCPGLSLILGYKPKVDLPNGYKETALLKAVKCNKPQAKHVVQLLVNIFILKRASCIINVSRGSMIIVLISPIAIIIYQGFNVLQ